MALAVNRTGVILEKRDLSYHRPQSVRRALHYQHTWPANTIDKCCMADPPPLSGNSRAHVARLVNCSWGAPEAGVMPGAAVMPGRRSSCRGRLVMPVARSRRWPCRPGRRGRRGRGRCSWPGRGRCRRRRAVRTGRRRGCRGRDADRDGDADDRVGGEHLHHAGAPADPLGDLARLAQPVVPVSRMTNSSPPNRPTRSDSRTCWRISAASVRSTASPVRWPWVSLTILK